MGCVSTKCISQLLTVELKGNLLKICTNLLQQAKVDVNFKKLIIMGDELWFYRHDIKTMQPYSKWN